MTVRLAYVPGEGKSIFVNGAELDRLADIVGTLPVVVFSPEDYDLTAGGPSERRRFVNNILSQARSVYMETLMKYRRARRQRNEVLRSYKKRSAPPPDELLAPWTEKLVGLGSRIVHRRQQFLQAFGRPRRGVPPHRRGGRAAHDRVRHDCGPGPRRDARRHRRRIPGGPRPQAGAGTRPRHHPRGAAAGRARLPPRRPGGAPVRLAGPAPHLCHGPQAGAVLLPATAERHSTTPSASSTRSAPGSFSTSSGRTPWGRASSPPPAGGPSSRRSTQSPRRTVPCRSARAAGRRR